MALGNDSKKLMLFGVCPGRPLHSLSWTDLVSPDTDTWYIDFSLGEIYDLQVDGVSMTKESSLADCKSTADSFYHDFFAGRLYLHLTAGDDPGGFVSPDYTYNIIAYVWKIYSNRQVSASPALAFVPDGCTFPILAEPALTGDSLSELSASVADHFESAMQMAFGGVSLVNDGAQWWAEKEAWYWENAAAWVKIGDIEDSFAALDTVFIGRVKTPEVNDFNAVFQLVDIREGRLQSIPTERMLTADYANLDPNAEGKPKPVLFGEKKNITPICYDTSGHSYKISKTNWGLDSYPLESIDAVYLKGVALSVTTHYTEDLANGNFTLTFDPGDGEITCDAKGISCGFDFSSSPFGAATGVYSENVADILFFILHVMNDIPVSDIDITSFYELQTARTQKVAFYLDKDTATMDINRMLQQTSLYHFLPLANGTFAARYYRKTVPSGTLELRDYDHKDFRSLAPSGGVFRDIFLKYDQDPTTGVFKILTNSESKVEERYRTKDSYTIETALRDESEAQTILNFYVQLLRQPPQKISDSISMIGRSLVPTDKLYVSRTVNADGHEVVIATDDVYVALDVKKNFQGGRVDVVMQKDTQLAIYTTHADSPHQDVPHVDHSDTIHEDDTHGDDHTDDAEYIDHSDVAHQDVAHEDHSDASHDDHSDGLYSDYTDVGHDDTAHADIAHEDHQDDIPYADVPHVDTSHVDHSDTVHGDAHTDVSHIDSEV